MDNQKNIWWKVLIIFFAGAAIGSGTLYLIMRADAADARATIARISDELAISKRDTAAALSTAEFLRESNTKLENNLRDAQNARATSEARARDLQKTLRGAEQELQSARGIVDQLAAKNNELRKETEGLRVAIDEQLGNLGKLEARTKADAERISELENDVSGYISRISELQEQITGYIQQIASIGSDIGELRSLSNQFDTTIASIAGLAQDITKSSGTLDGILAAIERFIDEGLRGIESLEGINSHLKETIARFGEQPQQDK